MAIDHCGMNNYYESLAEVLPLLLLAFMWESHYLDRLPGISDENRKLWKKPVVRVYVIFVSIFVLASIAVCVLVLSGYCPENSFTRIFVLCGTVILLVTMSFRLYYDITDATSKSGHRIGCGPTGKLKQ